MLHHAGSDDTANEGSCQTDESSATVAATRHEGHHHQTHTKRGTEVGQRSNLVLLKVATEGLIFRQRDDGGVVAQEGHHSTKGCHTREVVKRLHQRLQHLLQQHHHTKLHEEFTDGTCHHRDGHNIEHCFYQQLICCIHKRVQHIRQTHLDGEAGEETEEQHQKDDQFPGTTVCTHHVAHHVISRNPRNLMQNIVGFEMEYGHF